MKWRTDKPTANVIVAYVKVLHTLGETICPHILHKTQFSEYYLNNLYHEVPYDRNLEEDETVTDCDELEREIERYIAPIHADEIKYEPFTSIEECARHFAKWGAEHLKK